MAFRIKDLMIAVLPPEGGAPGAGCGVSVGCEASLPACRIASVPDCGVSLYCRQVTLLDCGLSLPDCGVSLAGCRFVSVCDVRGSLVGVNDCGNNYSCKGCTNTCDAGCSRVQCSNYPTRQIPAQQLEDLRNAELLRMRAEVRIAMQERAVGEPLEGLPEETTGLDEIERLEAHLKDALEELRQERERRADSGSAPSKGSGRKSPEG